MRTPTLLVACEESQRVCTAFRERGWEAYSCDLLDCSGGHPEWHIKGDCLPLLSGYCSFTTADGVTHNRTQPWDLIIAHPPCTYLTISANRYYDVIRYGDKAKRRFQDRYKAIVFFLELALAPCKRIAVENPVGVMSTAWKKPDQIIQPFHFGHPYTKQTCLWLTGVPLLIPTDVLARPENGWENEQITKDGRYGGYGGKWGCKNGKWLRYGDKEVQVERSRTFPGIAKAMADQWGSYIEEEIAKEHNNEILGNCHNPG